MNEEEKNDPMGFLNDPAPVSEEKENTPIVNSEPKMIVTPEPEKTSEPVPEPQPEPTTEPAPEAPKEEVKEEPAPAVLTPPPIPEPEEKKEDPKEEVKEEPLNPSDIYEEVEAFELEKNTDLTKNESYFEGKVLDYMAYNFLRLFISIITIGIFKPWGDCIFYNYKFSHTIYNGKRLKFIGKPEELFVQRFRWIFFTIITLGIYALWIPIKKQKWITKNLFFEDEEIKRGDSFFEGKFLPLLGYNLLTTLLSGITLGLALPFCICLKTKWIVNNTVITRKRLVFSGKGLSLFGNTLLWLLLSIVTLGIYTLWVPLRKNNWFAKNTSIKLREI